jgi:DNA-binding response OmpR family regulator
MDRGGTGTLTILIIEDDRAMAGLVRTYLEHAGYAVLAAETGEEGLELAQRHRPHLIVLDLMLPMLSGWETCRGRRARDDVVNPITPRERVAPIGAVLRRQQIAPSQALSVGRLHIDPSRRETHVDGNPVPLREREFDLLLYLALHTGEVCARSTLLDHVWGYDFAGDERTIDSHVRRLREALGPAGQQVRTVWGIGYKLVGDPA